MCVCLSAKPAAYVPPALRNQPQAAGPNKSKYREEYELPSNLKQDEQSKKITLFFVLCNSLFICMKLLKSRIALVQLRL